MKRIQNNRTRALTSIALWLNVLHFASLWSCDALMVGTKGGISSISIPTRSSRSTYIISSSLQFSSSTKLYSTPLDVERATEVFEKFDEDNSGCISINELTTVLRNLDIDATDEEANALFRYLDGDGDGNISLDDFLPWYADTASAAKEMASNFQNLLIGRRTVDSFDSTPVSDDVLYRAIECAIAAPNRSRSEPWRFLKIGPQTVAKFSDLNTKLGAMSLIMEQDDVEGSEAAVLPLTDWTKIPGWCVVTTKISPEDPDKELDDYKSTCCAIQNFMLSMWSEGIGTKWTAGPVQKTQEFADLCGVDSSAERVVGCIWYGFATGGLINADPKRRRLSAHDVLERLP